MQHNNPFGTLMQRHGRGSMEVNGLTCTFHLPVAPKSRYAESGDEVVQGLPPAAQRNVFVTDEFPGVPANWMKSSGTASSFFAAVKPGHAMWFDFNSNLHHTHHVAVLLSVQGINPITGRRVEGFHLEQYVEKCPVHDVPFGHERLCAECKFKWPKQNYLPGNATPSPYFWIDGFRAQDGVVRNWVFTEDTARGVAAQLIGDDRVFAIGIAFFLSKQPRPPQARRSVRHEDFGIHDYGSSGSYRSINIRGDGRRPLLYGARSADLEVAAGAKIHQRIYDDPADLDYWNETPAGVLYLNYADEATVASIVSAGHTDQTGTGEGFMDGLQTGH